MYKRIELINDNGNKEQKQIIKFIKDTFQLKYDYIYYDEIFYTIPTLTTYGISNYNRVINYKSGCILKTTRDNNKLFVSGDMYYDNGKKCGYPIIQKLWNKFRGMTDIIDINKSCKATHEIDFMQEKEFYRYVPGFPKYRASNYGNIKIDQKDEYIKSHLKGGYYQITLFYNNKPYTKNFHQIIILPFKGKPPTNNHTVEP